MNNPIDQIISDVRHGSTFLFKQTVEYLLTLDDDHILTEGKSASKKLADHFSAMGLFQKLQVDIQNIQSVEKLKEYLRHLLYQLSENQSRINAIAIGEIHPKNTLLTISHSSMVREVVKGIYGAGKLQKIYCLRSEPANEGETLVQELLEEKVPAFLIEDREYKSLNGKIDLVITGCDLLAPAFFINKMGTQILAEWAEKNQIHIWIVGDSLRLIPGFNKKLSPDSLFEQVNYLSSMKILCEQGIILSADFSRLF